VLERRVRFVLLTRRLERARERDPDEDVVRVLAVRLGLRREGFARVDDGLIDAAGGELHVREHGEVVRQDLTRAPRERDGGVDLGEGVRRTTELEERAREVRAARGLHAMVALPLEALDGAHGL